MTLQNYIKLADAATDGPWNKTAFGKDVNDHTDCGVVSHGGYSICRAPRYQTEKQYDKDFTFIATSRTLGPAMAKALIEAEEALKGVYEFFDTCKTDKFGRMRPTKAQGEQAWFAVSQALAQIQSLNGGEK